MKTLESTLNELDDLNSLLDSIASSFYNDRSITVAEMSMGVREIRKNWMVTASNTNLVLILWLIFVFLIYASVTFHYSIGVWEELLVPAGHNFIRV